MSVYGDIALNTLRVESLVRQDFSEQSDSTR